MACLVFIEEFGNFFVIIDVDLRSILHPEQHMNVRRPPLLKFSSVEVVRYDADRKSVASKEFLQEGLE
jgi:hypothetical protein